MSDSFELHPNEGLIPLEVSKFIPPSSEKIGFLLEKRIRRIFIFPKSTEKTEYSDFENEKLEELISYANEQNSPFPSSYKTSSMLRHLQGNDYDIKKSYENCLKEIQYYQNYIPTVSISEGVLKVLNTGFVYYHGRDNRFRPILVVNPGIFNTSIEFEHWEKASVFFTEYILSKTLVPGKVENWDIIVDFSLVKPQTIPWALKNIFARFKGVYRCRLYKLFLLNLSPILQFCWKIACTIMGPTVEAKATMVETEDGKYNKMFTFINRDQVEKKYGGNAPDLKEGEYFPMKFYNSNFASEEEIKESKCLFKNKDSYFDEEEKEIFCEIESEGEEEDVKNEERKMN